VTWRTRFLALLSRGEQEPVDPESLVEVAAVWLHEGPMLVSLLESAGIEAVGVEGTNYVMGATSSAKMRVFVRARDVTAAEPIVTDALRANASSEKRFFGSRRRPRA
jgi:hypothetical protein